MTNEELIEEAKRYYSDNFEYLSNDQPTLSILTNVARHFAEWGSEHLKKLIMAKYIDVEKLKAEIERRIEETKSMKPSFDQFWAGQISAFKGCLNIIDSHQQEQPKPVPADLEEAADEMAIRAFPEKKSYSTVIDRVVDYNAVDRKNYRDGIIAGAKWQKDKMMKDAVKWLVDDDYDELTDKGRFILGSVGIGYNGYYIPYSDLLKLPKEDEQ